MYMSWLHRRCIRMKSLPVLKTYPTNPKFNPPYIVIFFFVLYCFNTLCYNCAFGIIVFDCCWSQVSRNLVVIVMVCIDNFSVEHVLCVLMVYVNDSKSLPALSSVCHGTSSYVIHASHFFHLFVHLSVCPSVCVFICLSVCMCACVHVFVCRSVEMIMPRDASLSSRSRSISAETWSTHILSKDLTTHC